MASVPTSPTHPVERSVKVCGGKRTVKVRPWTMAVRHSLRPRLSVLIGRVTEVMRDQPRTVSWQTLFEEAEEEVYQVVRETLGFEDAQMDELWYEDLPILAQAVFEVCVMRDDGGGVLGKLAPLATNMLQQVVVGSGLKSAIAERKLRQEQTSAPNTPSSSKGKDSPSSPAAGAPVPSSSDES